MKCRGVTSPGYIYDENVKLHAYLKVQCSSYLDICLMDLQSWQYIYRIDIDLEMIPCELSNLFLIL